MGPFDRSSRGEDAQILTLPSPMHSHARPARLCTRVGDLTIRKETCTDKERAPGVDIFPLLRIGAARVAASDRNRSGGSSLRHFFSREVLLRE